MTLRRHLYSALAALVAFAILTLMSGSWGVPALVAAGVIALACTLLYFHYRTRGKAEAMVPVTPSRDDRVIPQAVKIAVAVRDKGLCQIKGPPCTGVGEVYDHVFPWSKGGSSKEPSNIQMACSACNSWKSDKVLI